MSSLLAVGARRGDQHPVRRGAPRPHRGRHSGARARRSARGRRRSLAPAHPCRYGVDAARPRPGAAPGACPCGCGGHSRAAPGRQPAQAGGDAERATRPVGRRAADAPEARRPLHRRPAWQRRARRDPVRERPPGGLLPAELRGLRRARGVQDEPFLVRPGGLHDQRVPRPGRRDRSGDPDDLPRSYHVLGWQSEAAAECYGMQSLWYTANRLGASVALSQELASWYWVHVYPLRRTSSHPEYWSAECRDGGKLDLRPATHGWPS